MSGRVGAVWIVAASAALCAGGCAPKFEVAHVIPGALPAPFGRPTAQASDFRVASANGLDAAAAGELAAVVAQAVWQQGAASALAGPLSPGEPIHVTGQIHPELADHQGTRIIRVRDAATGQMRPCRVDSLIREASLRVEYTAMCGGRPIGTAECRSAYSSNTDPAVAGRLGLARVDDPSRTPPPGVIFRNLAQDNAHQFVAMIQPTVIRATIQLRYLSSADGQQGLRLAQKRQYAFACEKFRQAMARPDESQAARFNLAACAEADGDYATAAENYKIVAESATNKSLIEDARAGHMRSARMLLVAGSKGPSSAPAGSASP
jgi:hypothetical protein